MTSLFTKTSVTDLPDVVNVNVLCVQEMFAEDFSYLSVDQIFFDHWFVDTQRREAAFLFQVVISGVSVLDVEDSVCVRGRVFHDS